MGKEVREIGHLKDFGFILRGGGFKAEKYIYVRWSRSKIKVIITEY